MRLRALALLALVVLALAAAIVTVSRLQDEATASRDAELQLISLRLDMAQIQDVPWGASPDEGDSVASVRGELQDDQDQIEGALAALARGGRLPERATIDRPFGQASAALWKILELSAKGKQSQANPYSDRAARQIYQADLALQKAAKRFRAHSVHVLRQARFGSALVIALLFAAFAWFYLRVNAARRTAEALTAENRELLAASREEALTDALTGLGNRRALMLDLEAAEQAVLGLFDLDGFKQYNDEFGHPAGDALLKRLGERLAATMSGIGTAYRMGGDEFCILTSSEPEQAHAIASLAAAALSEAGEGFSVGCSYGFALMPGDAATVREVLQIADERMYRHKKSGRIPPSRQSADVLLQVLAERPNAMGQQRSDVGALAEATAEHLGLAPDERERIRLAAELHDIGKSAIPDAILEKPSALDAEEWDFIRRHSAIGERIVRAAPSLAYASDLVRWHHERYDGSGYPDGLAGDEIPIGARVIAVSDAFDAMVGERPYRGAISLEEALAELRSCAGSQFDPEVVEAFVAAALGARRTA